MMKWKSVTVVKIYTTEASHLLEAVVSSLQNEIKIKGITVYRAIAGYGESGAHLSSWVDLSLDLPLVIEFFDEKVKVERALALLTQQIKPLHIVCWEAKVNE